MRKKDLDFFLNLARDNFPAAFIKSVSSTLSDLAEALELLSGIALAFVDYCLIRGILNGIKGMTWWLDIVYQSQAPPL